MITNTTSQYSHNSRRDKVFRFLERRYWRFDDPADCYMEPWLIAWKLGWAKQKQRDAVRYTLYYLHKHNRSIRRREHYKQGQRVSWYGHEGYVYGFDQGL